jgi:Methyltransferase domain
LADKTDRLQNELDRYVRSYLTREIVQSPVDASADPQLATIIGKIAERLSDDREGAILDVGCGHGTMLSRLAELPQFRDRTNWTYVAIDEDDKLDELARLTRRLGISRRVEPTSLASFYKVWPRHGSPQLVFCRNVLHELTMPQTAQLLQHVASNLDVKDELIIQDLLRFPESERHHACWLTEKLVRCVQGHGFETVSAVQQGSRSGNAWLNIVAKNRLRAVPSRVESERLIVSARQEQWEVVGPGSGRSAKPPKPPGADSGT